MSGFIIDGRVFRFANFASCQFGQKYLRIGPAPTSAHNCTRLAPQTHSSKAPTRRQGTHWLQSCALLHCTTLDSCRQCTWHTVAAWVDNFIFIMSTPDHGIRFCAGYEGCCEVCAQQQWREKAAHQHSAIGQGARCRAAGAYTGVGVDTFRCLYLMLPDKLKALRASVVSPLVNLISTMRLITVVSGKAFQYGCAIAFVRLAAASLSQAMYGAESCIGPGGALPAGGEVEREVERVCLGRPRRGVTVAH